jgi:hypothetical protein
MTKIMPMSTRHLGRLLLVQVATVAVTITPSLAMAATPDEAVAGISAGIYIESGAEDVDTAGLRDVIADANEADLDVTVVVLAEATDAVAFAGAVNDRVPGTVLVFTPDAYGVTSTELAQATLDDALDDAADDLSSPDIVEGVAAFVDAASPSNMNWALIFVLGVLVVAAIGITGRVVERRATRGRREALLRREWGQLEARADLLASPVLDLSTRVELAESEALADRYRLAANKYGEIRDELAENQSADAVEQIQRDLDELERRLDELEEALDATAG